jgi:glycosyltransferase involved in cell wall biosynthesis
MALIAMPDKPILAYLTSAYARASDTFIRGEVRQLRALGFAVHTFSIRRAEAEQVVSEDVRREQSSTEYLLDGNKGRLLSGALRTLIGAPGRCLGAVRLAQRCSPPGIKPRLWHLAYVLEAAYLAGRLGARGVQHLHNHIGENSATVAMLAAHIAKIPFSLTIHGPNEFDHPKEIALGEKICRSAFVAAISSYGRSQLWRWCPAKQWDKIKVVHCGVDETFLGQPPTPFPDNKRLVSIGRLSEQKGQLLLVEAAATVAAAGAEFEVVLIGDGPMRPQIEEAIGRLGLGGIVRLAGWMDSQAIRRELIESRALVMPSFAEGLPVVIMESLALGRPVLSTSIAGIPELVRDGVNGWLVPAGSVDDLAEGIRRVLATPTSELDRMGRSGAEAVSRGHNAASEAGKLAGLFCESVGKRS